MKDTLDRLTGTNHRLTPNNGKREVYGTCPRCGNRDGCFVWIEDDHIHWYCNSRCGDFTERAFFDLAGWTWDYRPLPVQKERAKPMPFNPDHPKLKGLYITDEHVHRYHERGADKALELLSPYGIDASTVERNLIGYVDYVPTMGDLAGKRVAGITFPRWLPLPGNTQCLMGVSLRRDSCADPAMPKYKSMGGGFIHGVYNCRVVCSPDGRYVARPIDGLFVCEDEKTTILLNQVFGVLFPHLAAIAYKPEWTWDAFMDIVVSNTAKVVVLQDNEPDKVYTHNGQHYNPGLDRALKVRSLIHNRPAYILHHPEHKQLSDMVKATGSVGAMVDWLAAQRECSNLF